MNGKLATFFKILGRNVPGIAVVWGFLLTGYGAFLVNKPTGFMVCGGLLFVLAFILLLPDGSEGR
ncbi:hypothetical protein DMC16_14985 [Lacticaseibacillus paracasei]|uniref:hypothetical protein n=1 Tax=Lacticaseibacillus paracasei TaxID=1597 RepID=UPI0005EB7B4E|nr:hypothetical protein [Lacticaseibacillus paracasei]AWR92323.1 hypothetical protein DMC16_14985 [Lacticaseibacillus paracasei]MCD0433103.1 hypothetical protein [Lacticaseibacillus paracasei subsp. paracasei]